MNEKNTGPRRKWWMGWPTFFRVLYGAAILVLIAQIVLFKWVADSFFPTPSEMIICCAVVFVGLMVLAFPFFWSRFLLARLAFWVWRPLRWLFGWRMIRRYLYVLAALALLAALFYTEENWRGKRDWEHFKRAAEAKGERFELSSFMPPAVPDDQNFAFSPIVSNSCFSRIVGNLPEPPTANASAGRILDIKINARYEWKPWPTNYPEGNWQYGEKTDLKALQTYYRAPVTLDQQTNRVANWGRRGGRSWFRPDTNSEPRPTNEFPVAPQPQSPAVDVLLALSKYDSTIEELRQASHRPFFQFPIQFGPYATNKFFVNPSPLEECAKVLRLRAVAELENSQSEKAFEDVKLMLYLANLKHPELRRQTWYMNYINFALQPVWQGLVDHQWSDTQLSAIEKELARFDFLSDYQYFVRSLCAEKIEEINFFEHIRFHDYWANLNFKGDPHRHSLWNQVFSGDTLGCFIPKGWFYENDVAVARFNQQLLRTDAEVDKRIISSEIAKRLEDARTHYYLHRSIYNRMAWNGLDFGRIAQNYAFAQSSLDQARIACALERHRLATGEYPATLGALIPRFMNKLPHDIINDQPLHYRRTENGRFLLYSVGWNGTDDGGIVARQKKTEYSYEKAPDGKAPLDKSSGDWVWPNPE